MNTRTIEMVDIRIDAYEGIRLGIIRDVSGPNRLLIVQTTLGRAHPNSRLDVPVDTLGNLISALQRLQKADG